MTPDPRNPGPWPSKDSPDQDHILTPRPTGRPWSTTTVGTPSGTPGLGPEGTPGGSPLSTPYGSPILPMPWIAKRQDGKETLQSALWFDEGEGGGNAVAAAASPSVVGAAPSTVAGKAALAGSTTLIVGAGAVAVLIAAAYGLYALAF